MKKNTLVFVINVDWYFHLHWLNRAKSAMARGYQVKLITNFSNDQIKEKLENSGIECFSWGLSRFSANPISGIFSIYSLNSILKKIRPNLIHAITIKPNVYISILSNFLKIPYVLSVTGTGIIFSSNHLREKIIRWIVVKLYQLKNNKVINNVIFENHFDKQRFVESGICNRETARVILGAGVDLNKYKYSREKLSSSIKILFASRLLKNKGLFYLIEACRQLRSDGKNFELHVAGLIDENSPNAIRAEQIAEWVDEGIIYWFGTSDKIPDLIAKSHIVVLPTYYGEGVPRILIEASACGRPIVATDIPGCREILHDQKNGLLIPVHDSIHLAGALATLMTNKKMRTDMGKAGRKIVEQSFSDTKVIDETLGIYRTLLH